MAELLVSPQAQASAYAFTVVERRSKKPPNLPDAKPRRVQKVGIVGAGLMATQLATLFLRRLEVPVVLRDLDQARVDEALGTIRAEVGTRKPFLATIVDGGTGWDQFADCDLVLEAVFEELDVKRAGVRGGAQGRAGRDPRDEHVVALGRRDGRGRRTALLQPGRGSAARRDRAHAADDGRAARNRVGRRQEAEEARRARRRRAGVRRQPRADAHDDGADGLARERQHGRGDRRGGAVARVADGAVGAAADGRPAGREPRARDAATRPTPTASPSRRRSRTSPPDETRSSPPARPAEASSRSARTPSRRSPTRSGTCSTKAWSQQPPTSMPA